MAFGPRRIERGGVGGVSVTVLSSPPPPNLPKVQPTVLFGSQVTSTLGGFIYMPNPPMSLRCMNL